MFLGTVAGVVAEFSLGGIAFFARDDFTVHDHDTPVIFVLDEALEKEPLIFWQTGHFFKQLRFVGDIFRILTFRPANILDNERIAADFPDEWYIRFEAGAADIDGIGNGKILQGEYHTVSDLRSIFFGVRMRCSS